MRRKPNQYAPREVFEQILTYVPIATFDLILECEERGIVMVRRKIPPYRNVWALPGLRMLKGESIPQALERIARNELGISIRPERAQLVGQYVAKFTTEHSRQDISTCYAVQIPRSVVPVPNPEHFTGYRFIARGYPNPLGAMYRHHIAAYRSLKGTYAE